MVQGDPATDRLLPRRIALVVHPTRAVERALDALNRWAAEHGVDVVQLAGAGGEQHQVAQVGELESGDLVLSVGGDGTALWALRAAAPKEAPVLAVACGSLGALTAVTAEELPAALERLRRGDWRPSPLPALAVTPPSGPPVYALNDFVVFRRGAGQVIAAVFVDDELYVRLAGDGLVVATPIGSSAYSMAAGGPLLAPGTPALVCTPIAMHGGNAPPLVVPRGSSLTVEVEHSYLGFVVELDGERRPIEGRRFALSLEQGRFNLVTFGRAAGPSLEGLRRRGLIADSPRVVARDDRAADQGGSRG